MKRASSSAVPDPGAFIYAYCNVRTKQVLYSLERSLRPHHLKQLPDAGANNTPPTLRKDSWRPLFSVSLAQNEVGRQQSRYIFAKLREYRQLHETNWTPSPLLSRPYSKEEIDEMKEKLSQRGGSKRETVYDIIKRKKWKMRAKAVMDQKANSIADLAAILLKQDAVGEEFDYANKRDMQLYRQEVVKKMLSLASKAQDGGLERAENELKSLQEQLKTAPRKEKGPLTQRIEELDLEVKMMHFALPVVAENRETIQPLVTADAERHAREVAKAKELAAEATAEKKRTSRSPEDEEEEQTVKGFLAKVPPARTELDFMREQLPTWPKDIDPFLLRAERRRLGWQQLRAIGKHPILRFDRPIFSTEGIAIRWANMLDAEYAEAWPAAVQQLPMGLSRHTAPLPPESERHPWQRAGRPEGEEFPGIAVDVPSFKATQLSKYSKRKAARRERESVLDGIKERILGEIRDGGKEAKKAGEVEGRVGGEGEIAGRQETMA